MLFKMLKLSKNLDYIVTVIEIRDVVARQEAKKLRQLLFEHNICSSHIPTQDMELNKVMEKLRRYNFI